MNKKRDQNLTVGQWIESAGIYLSEGQKTKLDQYHNLLLRWQKAINLVSASTLEDSAQRHFLDAAQIVPLLPTGAKTLVDLGSGAGFPGLVIALLCPELNVHLIESDQKKCAFLETVSRETKTPVTIHCARIETLRGTFATDVLTARALAPLPLLLDYTAPWFECHPGTEAFFLTGSTVNSAESDLSKWQFEREDKPSLTDPHSHILHIRNLRRGQKG